MKNKIIFIFLNFVIFFNTAFAENIFIQSKNISIDKNKENSIFENEVFVKTQDGSTIKSDYAEYNKKNGYLKIEKNISAVDSKNNSLEADFAEYSEKNKVLKTKGKTKIITSEKYIIEGKDITLNNSLNFITSSEKTTISDQDNNKIYLENFEYNTKNNIFKSIGFTKIEDNKGNISEFSQIYIDTKKKEILGTDIKSFLNQSDFKINRDNKPRIFANTMKINEENKQFNKSRFTLCDYRDQDKCPPWTIQASEMLHDNKKKTIFYENAVIKIYDIPIFYFPRLSHPDPTVKRRSGFLTPSFSDTKNLGSGLSIPYFWAIDKERDFTFTNKFYANENPLFLGEYRQAFEKSNVILDLGYTDGYKNTSTTKQSGDKSHLFLEFVKNFNFEDKFKNSLTVKTQTVSHDKYLKLYKIDSTLVDYNSDTIENSISFTSETDDFFLGFNSSVYETLKEYNNDKYEYILPEITFGTNLFSNNVLGNLDLQSNFKVRNFDTNKTTKFFVNDFDWNIRNFFLDNGVKTKLRGKLKNVNYETKNVENFKTDTTNEIYGAIGLLSELDLFKNTNVSDKQFLTPKMLIRYAPGKMRNEKTGSKIDTNNIFSLDRLNNENNFESGLNATVGFDYEIDTTNTDFNFSAGQIFNQKENKNMPDKTSLNEKVSDFVGSTGLNIQEKLEINYDFSLDQNFKDFNYNEISTKMNLEYLNFDFTFLEERKHIGNQKYFSTNINLNRGENGKLSFGTKRNLITDSAEYYDLSYEYLNDCLRAGLVYRREFYNDSELEPENSLMFKITLIPFGNINSPSFSQ